MYDSYDESTIQSSALQNSATSSDNMVKVCMVLTMSTNTIVQKLKRVQNG